MGRKTRQSHAISKPCCFSSRASPALVMDIGISTVCIDGLIVSVAQRTAWKHTLKKDKHYPEPSMPRLHVSLFKGNSGKNDKNLCFIIGVWIPGWIWEIFHSYFGSFVWNLRDVHKYGQNAILLLLIWTQRTDANRKILFLFFGGGSWNLINYEKKTWQPHSVYKPCCYISSASPALVISIGIFTASMA